MKRLAVLFPLLFLLTACSSTAAVWETVNDELAPPAEPEVYSVFVPLGFEADFIADKVHGEAVYTSENGDYTVTTKSFLATGLDSAVRQLTGFEASQLQLQKTQRHGLPEYRFAWYSADSGGRVCRGGLLQDGSRWYACVFAVDENAGGRYTKLIAEAFRHISLSRSEGF